MKKYSSYLIAFILFFITFIIATQYRYPELDELYFADAPVNLLINGQWRSHIVFSQFLYQPLHAFLLVPWLFVMGVSHHSVCGFGVLLGLITCILLVKYSKELHYVKSKWQEILIVVGFWALNTFTDYETFGRPDNLGMLIMVIILKQLLSEPNIKLWRILIMGSALITAGFYELPVMVFFFLFMILYSLKEKKVVWQWVKKGFVFGVGVVFGELLVCLFFFFNKATTIMGYIQYTFLSSMNANSESTTNLINRIWEAYNGNWYISAVYILALVVMVALNIRFIKFVALYVLLLPALMVLAGRFVPYYTWIYYIPIIVLLVSTLESRTVLSSVIIALFTLSSFTYFGSQWYITYGCQANTIKELEVIKRECHNYFTTNKSLISEFDNVVLSEEQLYYDAVNTKAEIWFQYRKHPEHRLNFYNYNDMNRSLSPRKRIDIANGSDLKGKMMAYYKKHNSQLPYFPDEGICIYTCDYEKTTSLNFMDYFGYKYECLDSKGDFSIYKFSKDI